MNNSKPQPALGAFDKYLFLWIALCAAAGLLLGRNFPDGVRAVGQLTVGDVSLPVAGLMFLLMFPAMAKVRIEEVTRAARNLRPTLLTLAANWIAAPPLMVWLANLFVGDPEMRAGAILLGIAPCTGMVLFWITLAEANAAHGIVVTAINALSTLLLYAPLATFYLGAGGVPVPFEQVGLSVLLFVGVLLAAGQGARSALTKWRGRNWFEGRFLKLSGKLGMAALLAMLVLLFSSEGQMILDHPLVVALIAVPITLHLALMLILTHAAGWLMRLRYEEAAMASLIGSSTQFEVAIGTAMAVFGLGSGAALATVVGPLIEVPVMVAATRLLRRTKSSFARIGRM